MRIFKTLLLTLITAPAFAQSPVVAPWSDVTGEVRNYKNFRSLQIDPKLGNPQNNQYQAPRIEYETNQKQNPSIQPPINTAQPYLPPVSENEEPSSIEAMYASRIA